MNLDNPIEDLDDTDTPSAVVDEVELRIDDDIDSDTDDINDEFDQDLAKLHAIGADADDDDFDRELEKLNAVNDEDEDEPMVANTSSDSTSEVDSDNDDDDNSQSGSIPTTLEQLKLLGEEEPVIEVQTTSKAARARAYFIANFGKPGFERKHFIAKFRNAYKLSPAGAGTYYQKFIEEAREGKIIPKHGVPAPKK